MEGLSKFDSFSPAAPLLPDNNPQATGMAAFYGGTDPFADAASPVEDPTVTTQMASVLASAVQHTTIGAPEPDVVSLPAPIKYGDGWVNKATVRELNGGDEEALARAAVSGEPERVLDALLQRGVVSIGTLAPNAADLLKLAVVNRDALLLGIRIATYGTEIAFEKLSCTRCGENIELTYDLSDVPSRPPLPPGHDEGMVVPLRRGGRAVLRLPSGDDQVDILAAIRAKNITRAEQDTMLIGRCLVELRDAANTEVPVNGAETARELSMPDRTAILRALDEYRPGPRLEEASVVCPWCEQDTEVPLSIDILFRG
ncbi:hypothetical protein GCM10010149_89290 [Nonomuraea roseoviolacea subsp. roseoviolacea]|uniref:hypothetical protein n=1 Tax=Nonomuraea roseoviolacea TaxID=103837 RepID=UPI0031CE72A3